MRPGTFVRLDREVPYVDDEPERPRKGRPLYLRISKKAFATVISSKAKCPAHSGALEAHAVSLSLRWLLRSVHRHSKRTVLLVDATAVCGALAKGRSSSPTLKHELRRIAALAIAGDLWIRVVYIPSEDNPADAPSRGIVRKWRTKQCLKASAKARKRVYDANDDIHRLTHTGPAASQNSFRRLFRKYSWSDISSLSSIDATSERAV